MQTQNKKKGLDKTKTFKHVKDWWSIGNQKFIQTATPTHMLNTGPDFCSAQFWALIVKDYQHGLRLALVFAE